MKDAYSFHATEDDFDREYKEFHRAYLRVFARLGIPVIVVESSGGYMGGDVSHEFMLEAGAGEDTILLSKDRSYAVNAEFASLKHDIPDEDMKTMEEVETPDSATIEDVARHVGVDTDKTLKAMFYDVRGELVFVVIRGDLDVNLAKLGSVVNDDLLKPASREMIEEVGAVPGYASPVGLSEVTVIADESARTPNLVAGANREGYHLKNVNLGRDYQATVIADIALVREGMPSPVDGTPLEAIRGIEVGNIFSLGLKYSAPLNAIYLDDTDQEHAIIMGSYGIGVGRNMAAIAEHWHDDDGLVWPISVAPFEAHIVVLGSDEEIIEHGERLYRELTGAGVDTLIDDREVSAGIKFNDADLIGVPLRITVSPRSLKAGGIEVKRRDKDRDSAVTLPVDEVVAHVVEERDTMMEELRGAATEAEKLAPSS